MLATLIPYSLKTSIGGKSQRTILVKTCYTQQKYRKQLTIYIELYC